MKIYLVGPHFTLAERTFNEQFANSLETSCLPLTVVLPQQYADDISHTLDFPQRMYRYCLAEIEHCDAVVAILDGADADSGTCLEIGYARAKGKVVIGVRTDFRACEDRGLNLLVSNACDALVLDPSGSAEVGDLTEEVVRLLVARVQPAALQRPLLKHRHRPHSLEEALAHEFQPWD